MMAWMMIIFLARCKQTLMKQKSPSHTLRCRPLVYVPHVRSDARRDPIAAKAEEWNCSSQMLYLWTHIFYKYHIKLKREKKGIAVPKKE